MRSPTASEFKNPKRRRASGLDGGAGAVAGGTGERVAREPLTGRVGRTRSQRRSSGPVGERAAPTPGQDPQPRASLAR
jgi:hypothetical protein